MCQQATRLLLVLLALNFALYGVTLQAAVIPWQPVFSIASASDIYNPGANGSLVIALDYSADVPRVPPTEDSTINGIPFGRVGRGIAQEPYCDSIFLHFGPGAYGSRHWETPTDDIDLDALLDSHWWRRDEGPARIELKGLEIGSRYSVQVIGIAYSLDVANSPSRTYEPDNGEGVYTGLRLRRGDAPSIRGVFTADSTTQNILLRSIDGDYENNIDPGICGLVLFEVIPEPGSVLLAVSGALVLLRRLR